MSRSSVCRILWVGSIVAGGLCLTGCSVEQRMAKVAGDIEATFANARDWEQLPLRAISWQQALSMVQQNNVELKSLAFAIERSEREGLGIYTEMIPGLSYYGYLTKSINDVRRIDSRDLNSSVNVTFNLPTITNIPYRVYAAHANTFSAIKTRELSERDIISKLYAEIRNREIELKKRALQKQRPGLDEQDRMLAASAERLADSSYWKNVAEFLGDYSARWYILPESLPRVKWSKYLPKLNKLSSLSVERFAIQLEQSRLRKYGVALKYLPTINTNLYSPSLFSSTGGTYEGAFLDGEDTNINLSASYTIDTQLDTWNEYMDSKDDYEITRRKVEASIISHKHKLIQLKRSVQDYLSWRSYMYKRIEYIEASPVMTATDRLTNEETLFSMKSELLNQEAASVESETAVILEYGFGAD